MIIEKVKVRQWRNIEHFEWQPHSRANLLLGDNAQGKTNLLEAIFLCATSKSLRPGASPEDMIRAGQEQARISVSVRHDGDDLARDIEFHLLRDGSKELYLNQKRARPFSKVLGQLSVVLFVPEDLSLVKAGPAARRSWLDLEISQASPQYLAALSEYQRALKQRNAAIRMVNEERSTWDSVTAFDPSLIQNGVEVMMKRQAAMAEITPIAQELQAQVSGEKESLGLSYICSVQGPATGKLDDVDSLSQAFAAALKARAREEAARGSTLSGPHRDDLEILLDGKPARLFASQGQQRTTALALKLAEVKYLRKHLGENPVLLLDDLLSELDLGRQKALLSHLEEHVQTFVSSTHAQLAPYKPGQIWQVKEGVFELKEGK